MRPSQQRRVTLKQLADGCAGLTVSWLGVGRVLRVLAAPHKCALPALQGCLDSPAPAAAYRALQLLSAHRCSFARSRLRLPAQGRGEYW